VPGRRIRRRCGADGQFIIQDAALFEIIDDIFYKRSDKFRVRKAMLFMTEPVLSTFHHFVYLIPELGFDPSRINFGITVGDGFVVVIFMEIVQTPVCSYSPRRLRCP
jgi:hypothetical protein